MDRIGLLLGGGSSSSMGFLSKQLIALITNQISYRSSVLLLNQQQKAHFHMSTKNLTSSKFQNLVVGVENTKSYRVYFKNERNEICSPFHDIPLVADSNKSHYNMVVEIPRWTQAKMEINKAEAFNPICQDVKNDKLRFVNNVFPYHGYIWNYGALPQTWEDPNVKCETTGMQGDNDPLDVCEIGSRVAPRGSVVQIKVLGALGLIDEGEADWKILAIDINDPLANRLNDVADVEKQMPGLLEATRRWFEVYKIPTGKPANKLANNGQFYSAEFANRIIKHDHKLWLKLIQADKKNMSAKAKKISLAHTSQLATGDADRVDVVKAESILQTVIKNVSSTEKPNLNQTEIDSVHFVDK